MNDETKALVKSIRSGIETSGWACDALDPRQVLALLAHVDGEQARSDARAEEVREACARQFPKGPEESFFDPWAAEVVRATPLTSTPLADRIAELERVLAKSLANRIVEKAKQADQPCGHPAAVANRSAETGVAFCDLCRLNEMLNDALAMEAKHKAERDALRDQVEEARAGLTEIACFHEGPEVHGGFDEPGSAQTARDTLAAMDEAKP